MAADDAVASKLLATCRRLGPVKVRVYDAADESRDIAVPTRRSKWSQVIAAVDARPWVRCELLNKEGAVLGYVENDGAPSDVEDLGAPASGGAAQTGAMLRLMLDAQRVALTYRDKEHVELMRGMGDMMRTQTDAIKQLVGLYQAQVSVAAEVAAMQASAEAGGDIDQWVKLIEAAPQGVAAIAPLLRVLMAGKQASKPNGAKAKE